MQIKPINYVDIDSLPFDYDPDKNPSNKAFGLKRSNKILYHPNACKTLVDKVELANGKTITYSKTYDQWGKLSEKLAYLRDTAGEWIKSKLQYYENGKVVKTLKGRK